MPVILFDQGCVVDTVQSLYLSSENRLEDADVLKVRLEENIRYFRGVLATR